MLLAASTAPAVVALFDDARAPSTIVNAPPDRDRTVTAAAAAIGYASPHEITSTGNVL